MQFPYFGRYWPCEAGLWRTNVEQVWKPWGNLSPSAFNEPSGCRNAYAQMEAAPQYKTPAKPLRRQGGNQKKPPVSGCAHHMDAALGADGAVLPFHGAGGQFACQLPFGHANLAIAVQIKAALQFGRITFPLGEQRTHVVAQAQG